MSKVIFVDFVNKMRVDSEPAKAKKAKAMSQREATKVSKRIDEINATLNQCDPDHDFDVIENLERELSQLQTQLAKFYMSQNEAV